jgi:PPM family protein phosphatase
MRRAVVDQAHLRNDEARMVQKSIENWYSHTQDSSFSLNGEFNLVTSVGCVRDSNQDRIGVLRVASSSVSFLCACVCDGMGGLKNGDRAASKGIAAFFSELIKSRRLQPVERLEHALQYANRQVSEHYPGGGSTLSAALIESGDIYIANVGDSRIFGFSAFGELVRLTIDDTMSERYGADSRGLLQYLGLKKDLKPDIQKVSGGFTSIILASDGCYSIGETAMKALQESCSDALIFSKRAVELSKWFGGHDNSSIIFIPNVHKATSLSDFSSDVSVFSTLGRMKMEWIHEDNTPPVGERHHRIVQAKAASSEPDAEDVRPKVARPKRPRTSTTKKPRDKATSKTAMESDQQFSIGFDDDEGGR